MDSQTKAAFGLLMGEVYRMQAAVDPDMCLVNDATIFGLLNGVETAIDEAFDGFGLISNNKYAHVVKVLQEIHDRPDGLATFRGYYDIEGEIGKGDVNRAEAIRIMKHLFANDSFCELLAKMDSSNSPIECRNLKVKSYRKGQK